ncbi:hypothetical protein AB0L50_09460 [Streptomyces flaveolus]|uniref:hypothetical protein n=1 Tax=Streptomyces flaveolus TaxID=67297 RepID=UPI00343E4543
MANEDSMVQTRLVPFLGVLVVGVILIWAGIESADIGALLASLTPVFVTEWMRRPQGHAQVGEGLRQRLVRVLVAQPGRDVAQQSAKRHLVPVLRHPPMIAVRRVSSHWSCRSFTPRHRPMAGLLASGL